MAQLGCWRREACEVSRWSVQTAQELSQQLYACSGAEGTATGAQVNYESSKLAPAAEAAGVAQASRRTASSMKYHHPKPRSQASRHSFQYIPVQYRVPFDEKGHSVAIA